MTDDTPLSGATSRETNVLVIDDDPQIRLLVSRLLRANGYRVALGGNGEEMAEALALNPIDLVVLDVMLPGKSGLDLCEWLRQQGSTVPVIMLTARGEETDRIAGLDLGADDYLAKPFSQRELLARINAIMRRVRSDGATRSLTAARGYRFVGWTLDLVRRELNDPDGVVVDLSTGKFDMLRAFVEAPRQGTGARPAAGSRQESRSDRVRSCCRCPDQPLAQED